MSEVWQPLAIESLAIERKKRILRVPLGETPASCRFGMEGISTMYAVIKTGGKQYRVAEGDTLQVEKLQGEPGDEISFDQVLLVGGGDATKVGTPTVEGATVKAQITAQNRGKKIVVFKMKRRKNYRRKNGHRQPYTQIKITGIKA